jgi:hypothetical protein
VEFKLEKKTRKERTGMKGISDKTLRLLTPFGSLSLFEYCKVVERNICRGWILIWV